ncbi:hypothetical protein TNCV_1640221 [Trichonephila clavipes]|nr:hypothetical protein TNCV_1640221 [Trichonephila clavipes]
MMKSPELYNPPPKFHAPPIRSRRGNFRILLSQTSGRHFMISSSCASEELLTLRVEWEMSVKPVEAIGVRQIHVNYAEARSPPARVRRSRQTWGNSVRFPNCRGKFRKWVVRNSDHFFPMSERKLKETPEQCAFGFSRICDDSTSEKIELRLCAHTDSRYKWPKDKRSKGMSDREKREVYKGRAREYQKQILTGDNPTRGPSLAIDLRVCDTFEFAN